MKILSIQTDSEVGKSGLEKETDIDRNNDVLCLRIVGGSEINFLS